MKKRVRFFLLPVLLLVSYLFISQLFPADEILRHDLVLSPDRKNISKTLLPLFEITGLKKPDSLKEAIALTQKAWIRPAGKERWQTEGFLALDEEKTLRAKEIFSSKLFMVEALNPSRKEYEYAVVLGAYVSTMRSRLAFLLKMMNERGLRFKQLVFLAGQRPRSLEMENRERLLGDYDHSLPLKSNWVWKGELPETEVEMAKLLVSQTEWPSFFSEDTVLFIDSPLQPDGKGGLRRPNTADTLKDWLAQNPKKGRILSVSSNPYCGYQNAVVANVFSDWDIETVGYASPEESRIELYFDSLARWLFQFRNL